LLISYLSSLIRLEKSRDVEIIVNGERREVAESTTITQLLQRLGLAGKYVAVEVDQEVVPRARHAEHRLKAGDTLEIVTLVGGG